MIVARVVNGVRGHFRDRILDWFAATVLFLIGLVLLAPGDLFDNAVTYDVMRTWAPEYVWGWACAGVGALRLAALIVNGTFEDFQWSPHVRSMCALLSCFAWFQLSIGVLASNRLSIGLVIFPAFLIADIWNIHVSSGEAAEADKKVRLRRGARVH